jgi:hypothetical protein
MSRYPKSDKSPQDRLPDQSYSPTEFADIEGISVSMLYKMWGQGERPFGKGPRFYYVGTRRRVTGQARRDWHREGEAAVAQPSNANEPALSCLNGKAGSKHRSRGGRDPIRKRKTARQEGSLGEP